MKPKIEFLSEEELLLTKTETAYRCLNWAGKRMLFQRTGEDTFVAYNNTIKKGDSYKIKEFMSYFKVPKLQTDEEALWRKRVKSTIKRMTASGVNPMVLNRLRQMYNSKMPYTVLEDISRLRKDKPKKLDDEFSYYFPYSDEYPFIMDESGKLDWFYAGLLPYCQTKTLWFGKENKAKKEQIHKMICEKTVGEVSGIGNYDVHFKLVKSLKSHSYEAFFSELPKVDAEYKDGYYYMAIDESSGIFSGKA